MKNIFKDHKAFIPFLMAGYPSMDTFSQAVEALIAAGADAIEIGVPFSDPVADGPTNQRAAEQAIANGTNLSTVLAFIKKLRQRSHQVPIILFTYLNPLLHFGVERFCRAAKDSGVNGLLVVDLPPEAGRSFFTHARQSLDIVLLSSPTTDPSRYALFQEIDPCFIYAISGLYVTGSKRALPTTLSADLQKIRTFLPHHKIAVGFGITTPEQAASVCEEADGVIIGSELIRFLEHSTVDEFFEFAHQFATRIHHHTSIT